MATVYWRVGTGGPNLWSTKASIPHLSPRQIASYPLTIASPAKANSLLLGIGEWKGRVYGQGFLWVGEMGVGRDKGVYGQCFLWVGEMGVE